MKRKNVEDFLGVHEGVGRVRQGWCPGQRHEGAQCVIFGKGLHLGL